MAVGIRSQPPVTAPQASDQGYVGQVLTALIDVVKKVWAQVSSLIERIFHFATCGRYAPLQPPQVPESSPDPVAEEVGLVSMESRDQFPIGGLPTDAIQLIFVQCLSNGDIKGFTALSLTNVHSYVTMRKLVNAVALTKLCPNLRILNAKTLKFQADLRNVDKCKVLRNYYKLEPSVEDREGLTIIFNQGGLTLKDMKENNCGIIVGGGGDISKELDTVPEEDTGAEMISNAPITCTRNSCYETQEWTVRDEGFDGMPTLIQYLALLITTQKELNICLYGEKPRTSGYFSRSVYGENPRAYGRSSTCINGSPLVVGAFVAGRLVFTSLLSSIKGFKHVGAGGRRKL